MYSVIIPTFNRCALLAEAIDSVLRQGEIGVEVIVVDDGSMDDTATMVAGRFPQVRYLHQDNRGPGAARNLGFREARGDLIALLDSDDIWLDGKLSCERAWWLRFPQADVVAGNASAFIAGALRSADTFEQRGIVFDESLARFFDWSMPIMQRGPVCCTSSMTLKRCVLQRFGPSIFDESLWLDEDWDLEFRLFSEFKVLLYPEIVCHTRIFHDDTRRFYSPAGVVKSLAEQRRIVALQMQIISRYLGNPQWGAVAENAFAQRMRELGDWLARSQ